MYDLSDEMIKKAKKNISKFKICSAEQKNIFDVKMDNDSIDLLISNLVIHILPNPDALIDKVHKLLKKDGYWYFSVLSNPQENTVFTHIYGLIFKYKDEVVIEKSPFLNFEKKVDKLIDKKFKIEKIEKQQKIFTMQ